MKRKITILMKKKKNYHHEDSIKRGKKDRRSGDNPTEIKGRKLCEARS